MTKKRIRLGTPPRRSGAEKTDLTRKAGSATADRLISSVGGKIYLRGLAEQEDEGAAEWAKRHLLHWVRRHSAARKQALREA